MSYQDAPFYYSRGGIAYFDGIYITGTRDVSGFSISGSVPEIDISTLTSPRREFVPGLADGGGVGMNLVAAMNSEIYKSFEESNDQQLTKRLNIFFGGITSDERRTDGGPIEIANAKIFLKGTGTIANYQTDADLTSQFALQTASSKNIECSKEYADSIPKGFTVGDFIATVKDQSDTSAFKGSTGSATTPVSGKVASALPNGFIPPVYYRINKITESGTGSSAKVILELESTANLSNTSFLSAVVPATQSQIVDIKIVRPAARFSIPVYIADFQHSTGAGGLIEMQVAYRITGKGDLYIGDKKTTEVKADGSPDYPTVPYLKPPAYFWSDRYKSA